MCNNILTFIYSLFSPQPLINKISKTDERYKIFATIPKPVIYDYPYVIYTKKEILVKNEIYEYLIIVNFSNSSYLEKHIVPTESSIIYRWRYMSEKSAKVFY
jgi:hypothetical protein